MPAEVSQKADHVMLLFICNSQRLCCLGGFIFTTSFFFFSSEKESTDHNINLPDFLCFVTYCDSFGLSILLAFPICQHPNKRHIYGEKNDPRSFGQMAILAFLWTHLCLKDQARYWMGRQLCIPSEPSLYNHRHLQPALLFSEYFQQAPNTILGCGCGSEGECLPNMGEALG